MAEFTFDEIVELPLPSTSAWTLMTDVPRVVSWIKVLSEVRELERLSSYAAVISDKVGMFSLRADLDIVVRDVQEPERLVFHAEGSDRQLGSRITIDVAVELDERETGSAVHVSGQYEITGQAATLGSSQIRRKGERVLAEFLGSLGSAASG
jgi:carbon monoxide dehydrogenase subunit G